MSCVSSRNSEFVSYFPPPRFTSRRYRRPFVRLDDDISDIWMERLLADLAQGTLLEKVKSRSRRLPRTFFLDSANMFVYYEGSTKKKKSDTTIKISKIREVREGEKDFSKNVKDLDLQRSHCFVIILGASQKIKYILAPCQEMRDKWIRGLRYVMQMEQLAEQRNETDRNFRDAFNRADINDNGHLNFEDIMKLLKSLNAGIKKKYARQMFDNADKNRNVSKDSASVLDREEFVFFYHSLTRRVEMEEIFLRFSNAKCFMNIRDLLTFLRDGQKRVDPNEDQCRDILDQYEPDGNCKQRGQLSLDGFRTFLTSEREQIFNPAHREVYQDMRRPITEYFIASSHNTNLSHDQLVGPSDSEMYIQALKKGCRCVELDCWDGPENDPVIYHGHTLTSKILFRDVIKAINEYAFITSPYPVILSIENHCSLQQQQVMANIMNLTFGEKIWRKEDDLIETPTPEKLKNKIIIKGNDLRNEAADIPDNNNNKVKGQEGQHNIEIHPELSKITTIKCVAFKSIETAAQKDDFQVSYKLGLQKA
ncbi:unnamed protein product [Lymnaea stagnalis]|uniref:Phosphoinositide phospholipase C n=1 Tax=Lymnaea stagnalis TaxID=6523 RepID=A0AAV2IS37_LYMST